MTKEVLNVLQAWFDEERGNRVTTNNMEALVRKIVQVVGQPQEAKDVEDNGTSS